MTSSSKLKTWSNVLLGDVTSEVSHRIGNNDQHVRIYGVERSAGLTPTPKYVAKNTSRYKKIEPGMFAYNPMRLNIGSLGYCSNLHEPGAVSPDYVVFECVPSLLDPLFMHYLTQSQQWDEWVRNAGVGSVRVRIYYRELAEMQLKIPPIDVQRAITDVLGSLDDKIEQNRRTGAKLEELSRGVFKAWFVDFEPVKAKAAGATTFPGMPPETFAALPSCFVDSELGPVPEGWELKPLYSAATFINGAAFKSSHFCDVSSGIPVVKIAELKAGITGNTKYSNRTDLDPRFRIDTGEILYSWSGSPDTSLDTFIWTKGPAFLNQHIFRVVTESEVQKVFVYYLLKHLKQDLIEIARNKQTTGLGHVTVGDMKRLQITWPDPKTLNGFRDVMGAVFETAFNGLIESEKLADLREYLLPRLLSGRVQVRDSACHGGRHQ